MMLKKILRIFFAALSVIFLIWFIIPVFWRIWHIGNIVGIFLCLALFFRTACYRQYNRIKLRMCSKTVTKIVLRIIQFGMTAVLIYCIVISSFMICAMAEWSHPDNATAIVLGAQVKSWGPSTILRQRIDAAEEYLKDHPKANAILTGGKGSDEPKSEAESMYETMIKDGISADRLYQEDQAKNTYENMKYSLELLRTDKQLKASNPDMNIAIVTDSYHQLRAEIITQLHNSDVGSITPINTKNTHAPAIAAYPSYFVREWIAIPVEFLK